MKYLKMLGLAAVAAMSFMAFAAGSASATTLEVTTETTNAAVTITASIESGKSATLSRTDGSLANTCTESHVHGTTDVFTGPVVSGPLTPGSAGLSFGNCSRPVTVHKSGSLSVTHISGTTDGTVSSSGAEVTVGSPFGTLNCKTNEGTHIGRLTGVGHGHATLDVEAVIPCGFLVPSALWSAHYEITTPTGLGVSA